jgi:tRNA(fMet)-specific endonuclease VapC
MFLLDTTAVIAALNGNPPDVVERLERELLHDVVALPVIALFEMRFGIAKSARGNDNVERLAVFLQLPIAIVPCDADDAEEASDIRAALQRAGTPIGPYDVLIAGQARRRGAVLVTANTREFTSVPGLRTEDWASA